MWRRDFFMLHDVHSQQVYFQKDTLVFVCHGTVSMPAVLTWCISMYHVIGLKQTCDIKNVTLKTAEKLWVLWSTEKSNKWPIICYFHIILFTSQCLVIFFFNFFTVVCLMMYKCSKNLIFDQN